MFVGATYIHPGHDKCYFEKKRQTSDTRPKFIRYLTEVCGDEGLTGS